MTFPEVVCVLGIGRNYRDHAAELGNDAPERPMVFAKAPFRVTGEGDPIVLPACCETEQVGSVSVARALTLSARLVLGDRQKRCPTPKPCGS